MRLVDLDPRWIMLDGTRVGFVFLSPAATTNTRRQSCFVVKLKRGTQHQLFQAMFGDERYLVQGCNPDCAWTIEGGIENATFETMTVKPSIDGSAGGNWHGHITKGEIK